MKVCDRCRDLSKDEKTIHVVEVGITSNELSHCNAVQMEICEECLSSPKVTDSLGRLWESLEHDPVVDYGIS